jgi:hypothetical protein
VTDEPVQKVDPKKQHRGKAPPAPARRTPDKERVFLDYVKDRTTKQRRREKQSNGYR